jgi:uncharacterized phage-associated protein
MCIGIRTNKELIGNLMILLANACKPLYHTKLLKLLYLIDEESVKRTGVPITWLNYKAWMHGPVTEDVYYSKIKGHNKFSDYVSFNDMANGSCIIKPVAQFDDGEFSDLDLQVINDILKLYGGKTARQLVDLTHQPDSLYDIAKKKHGIEFSEDNCTSEIEIDFQQLLDSDSRKAEFNYALENMKTKIYSGNV